MMKIDTEQLYEMKYNGEQANILALFQESIQSCKNSKEVLWLLKYAVSICDRHCFQQLLTIDVASDCLHENDNVLLRRAVHAGYLDIVQVLLQFENVRQHIDVNNLSVLKFAVRSVQRAVGFDDVERQFGIVRSLWDVPKVRELVDKDCFLHYVMKIDMSVEEKQAFFRSQQGVQALVEGRVTFCGLFSGTIRPYLLKTRRCLQWVMRQKAVIDNIESSELIVVSRFACVSLLQELLIKAKSKLNVFQVANYVKELYGCSESSVKVMLLLGVTGVQQEVERTQPEAIVWAYSCIRYVKPIYSWAIMQSDFVKGYFRADSALYQRFMTEKVRHYVLYKQYIQHAMAILCVEVRSRNHSAGLRPLPHELWLMILGMSCGMTLGHEVGSYAAANKLGRFGLRALSLNDWGEPSDTEAQQNVSRLN